MTGKLKRASKAKTAPRRKATKPPNDTALIRECVVYVQSVAGFHAGWKADPSGDSVYAAPAGERFNNRAALALEKITSTPATTAEGLLSKARIVPSLIQDAGGSFDVREKAFLASFGTNVETFLQPIIEEHWHAECAAEKGQVAS
jgi:hypothetical protein